MSGGDIKRRVRAPGGNKRRCWSCADPFAAEGLTVICDGCKAAPLPFMRVPAGFTPMSEAA